MNTQQRFLLSGNQKHPFPWTLEVDEYGHIDLIILSIFYGYRNQPGYHSDFRR